MLKKIAAIIAFTFVLSPAVAFADYQTISLAPGLYGVSKDGGSTYLGGYTTKAGADKAAKRLNRKAKRDENKNSSGNEEKSETVERDGGDEEGSEGGSDN